MELSTISKTQWVQAASVHWWYRRCTFGAFSDQTFEALQFLNLR